MLRSHEEHSSATGPEYSYGVATISRLLKIIGLFCKEPYKRDYILQKRPIILKSLLVVATLYLYKVRTCLYLSMPRMKLCVTDSNSKKHETP